MKVNQVSISNPFNPIYSVCPNVSFIAYYQLNPKHCNRPELIGVVCNNQSDYQFWTEYHEQPNVNNCDLIRYKKHEFVEKEKILKQRYKVSAFIKERLGQQEAEHYDLNFINCRLSPVLD